MAIPAPHVEVRSLVTPTPATRVNPLRALIPGGLAQLIRYTEPDEQALGELGEYAPEVDTPYLWPNRAVGGVVDPTYTRVYIQGAKLLYFTDLIGSDSEIAPVENRSNRIRSSTVNWKSTDGYDRDAALLDRDVQPGDLVKIRGVVGEDSIEKSSYVRGFAAEQLASEIDEVVAAESNLATQSADSEVEQTAGHENCVTLAADATGYNGLADGYVNDTYTAVVVTGSVDGDFTTAVVRVTSASGLDDEFDFVPAAGGVAKAVGARGLEFTFDLSADPGCDDESDTPEDLVPGQTWTIVVQGAYEEPRLRASGTYTGTRETTYIVEVTRGGRFDATSNAGKPQITVTTVHGSDSSGPTLVTSHNTSVALGTQGVLGVFYGSGSDSSLSEGADLDPVPGLRKGDKWYVGVLPTRDGRVSTLILGHDVGELVDATDLDLYLYIQDDIEVAQNREGFAPATNWSTSDTEITLASGLIAYDSSWTDDGVEQPLDVVGGTVYVTYRAWLPTFCDELNFATVETFDDLIPGVIHPDNPLKYGVWCALQNSNGEAVGFVGVCNPASLESWAAMLDVIERTEEIYNIAPQVYNEDVFDLIKAHVLSFSQPERGRWRACFLPLAAPASVVVSSAATSTDEDEILASLSDDPETSGTQYTLLQVPDGNSQFITDGAAPGDIVRFLFTTDGFDNVTYTEFVIDEVISETSLRLATGHSVAINVAQKMEIWHNRTKTELAEALAAKAQLYQDQRVVVVWPDTFTDGTLTAPGYAAAAMGAGLRSGVVPHQPLSRSPVSGITAVPRSDPFFSETQLQVLADAGIWILVPDRDGTIIVRHALTTDISAIETREEMFRANVDSVQYFFRRLIEPYVGRSNVVADTERVLRATLNAGIQYLKSNNSRPLLGTQIIDARVTALRRHLILRDTYTIDIQVEWPYPFNVADIRLVASATGVGTS